MSRRLFALDQNFPEPIVDALVSFLFAVELVPVRKIDPSLATCEDWELLLALHRHERKWDGLITNDAAMLRLPREMSVLVQTRLTLIVVRGHAHNPIRATGFIFSHIDYICKQLKKQSRVWELGAADKDTSKDAWEYLGEIAKRSNMETSLLYHRNKIPQESFDGHGQLPLPSVPQRTSRASLAVTKRSSGSWICPRIQWSSPRSTWSSPRSTWSALRPKSTTIKW